MAGRPPEGKRRGGEQQGARARRRVRARAPDGASPGAGLGRDQQRWRRWPRNRPGEAADLAGRQVGEGEASSG